MLPGRPVGLSLCVAYALRKVVHAPVGRDTSLIMKPILMLTLLLTLMLMLTLMLILKLKLMPARSNVASNVLAKGLHLSS